jgi:hypothetical protein
MFIKKKTEKGQALLMHLSKFHISPFKKTKRKSSSVAKTLNPTHSAHWSGNCSCSGQREEIYSP